MNIPPLKVSVITVCLNADKTIERAVQSVLAQTYPHIEYIVIDGASTDGTLAIIDRYRDRIQRLVSEPDQGIYDAMNKGVTAATGDIIYFLNADDSLLDPRVIADIAEEFTQDPQADILIGRVELTQIPAEGVYLRNRDHADYNKTLDILWYGVCHQAAFVRRALFENIGRFDTRYRIFADFDWFIRARKNRANFLKSRRGIAHYNYSGLSYTCAAKATGERHAIVYRNLGLGVLLLYVCDRVIHMLFEKSRSVFKPFLDHSNE